MPPSQLYTGAATGGQAVKKEVSRRGLFTGGWLFDDPPPDVAQTDAPPTKSVADLLSKSRNRAPWEKATRPAVPTGQVARVLVFDCLITMGSTCTSCIERCPEPGAIFLDGRTPLIDTDVCTGCGDCVLACPAPRSAIVLGPAT